MPGEFTTRASGNFSLPHLLSSDVPWYAHGRDETRCLLRATDSLFLVLGTQLRCFHQ